MHFVLFNTLVIVLISICSSDSNFTGESIRTCGKCSPCWNVFGKNYGPCSKSNYTINPFFGVQPICIDTLVLLIILFLSIVILLPTCIWFVNLWIQRYNDDHDDDMRYIIDGLICYY